MKRFFSVISRVLPFLLSCTAFAAQTCRNDIAASAPESRYQIQEAGTVTDISTGLIWKRCAEGQSWANNTCTGTATQFTWQEALQGAAKQSGWRLPNKNELASLLEERCVSPAINVQLFPETPASGFWSSSPYANYTDYAWLVYFSYSSVGDDYKGHKYAVRLARGGQVLDSFDSAATTPDIPTPTPDVTPATSPGAGYVEGWVYDACSKKPLKDVDVDFGIKSQGTDADGHYRRQLPFGSYTVKVAPDRYLGDSKTITIDRDNNPNGFVTFTLASRGGCAALKQSASSFKAIIVAGSGPYIATGYNNVWNPTQTLADRAYKALRLQGYDKDRILYLSADASPKDVDGDGKNDINQLASIDNLQQAITQWAGDVQDVVLYMVGNGGIRFFQLGKESPLSSEQLKSALDTLQKKIPGVVNVVLDSCYSGSFIEPLAAPKRYVITSTREDRNAIISNDGNNSFSFYFWDQVGLEYGSLSQAFTRARQAMSSQLVGDKQLQDAQLDADGSGAFAANDKDLISTYCFGTCQNGHLAVAPVIEGVAPSEDLAGKLTANLRITTSKPVVNAWVNIQRPDFHYPKMVVAQTNNLQVKLNCSGTHCQGDYQNFNLNDDYVLTYYAQDAEGAISQPITLKLNQSGIAASNAKKAATAVFEPSTGILTLKDVSAGGQHFYAELKDQGGFQFALQNVYQLTEALTDTPASFNGSKVTVPSVFAFGGYYTVELVSNGATFAVTQTVAK